MTAYLRYDVGKTALKRKITPKNPHQSAPIRISRGRLHSQNICRRFISLALKRKITPKNPINRLQFAFRAAAFTARIFAVVLSH
jgi:hypothetical protein